MRYIPKCYYTKPLLKLIDDYISDGYKYYSDLDDLNKELVAAECMDALGDDAHECIVESENFCKTINYFKKFLRTAKEEHSYDLVQVMASNAIEYFSGVMDELFSERREDRFVISMVERGLTSHVDRINGEISWRKSA
jgi:hypothetical protein